MMTAKPIVRALSLATLAIAGLLLNGQAGAVDAVKGRVLGAGAPIAGSTVTLWAATAGAPEQLVQARTDADGRFALELGTTSGNEAVLYLVAQGGRSGLDKSGDDNPAITLLSVLGKAPPANVTVNEFTTMASVWTHAQFLQGTAIRGPELGLRIASNNVPNLVDLGSGNYGPVILDPLNSTQSPSMAHFATLSTLVAGCVTRVTPDACPHLFAAATPPDGKVAKDTLQTLHDVAVNAAYQPDRLFALLDEFYPVPQGKTLRPTPFLPYLSFAPSAWLIGLKFTGGGLSAPGKIMFDSMGNIWTGANFIVGSQASDALWDGNMAKFAPNGRPLSPAPTGFHGGGLEGPGFGTAIDANDRVWITSTGSKTISLFDKDGTPLSPPQGYDFGGKLGMVQGIIVTPSGDVWALDFGNDQVIYMPQGDPARGRLLCQAPPGTANKDGPCKLNGPFHLAIDQQDRIWITNAVGDTVTRFPANDPDKVEVLPTGGHSGKGMAIDSQGNAWITNTAGTGFDLEVKLKLLELKLTGQMGRIHSVVFKYLADHPGLGSISMLRPDGTPAPGSPFTGGGAWGAWGVVIDGNDQVWVSNFAGQSITHLCGARTETCPPGMKTGDAISPPGGYVGGGMTLLTDIGIDPAGNVWVADNWLRPESCFAPGVSEALSTRCGGNGLTVFYGMAKPVSAPQIGPAQPVN